MGWSILHGSLTFIISKKMSKWVKPNKYYVSFPYGIYNVNIVKAHRATIRGTEPFYLSHGGKTVRDNVYLGFAFSPESWPKYKWHIKNQCTGGDRTLPIQERWSSRHFTLDKIFNLDIIDIKNEVNVEEYYSLSNWDFQIILQIRHQDTSPWKALLKPHILKGNTE